MDWQAIDNKLADIRQRREEGEDVAEEAARLKQASDELRAVAAPEEAQAASSEQAEALAVKAELMRRLFSVGQLDIPEGADSRLTEIAQGMAGRVISRAMEAEFNQQVEQYLQEVKDLERRISDLQARERRLGSRVDTLRAYQSLLAALSGKTRN